MNTCLITGSCGLIGSEAALYFAAKGFKIVGIDNDMRAYYFGPTASTGKMKKILADRIRNYEHYSVDVRTFPAVEKIFRKYSTDIKLIIHTAAQPSHDWASREPLMDFSVNATATLQLLGLTRQHCPKAVFIFTSTNKVYGDTPNTLPLKELSTRWDLFKTHPFYNGINESMSIDASTHSLFGVSKASADLMVQEYGRYFGMKTVAFRGGCLTGPNHAGAQSHGFLSYLMKCVITGKPYTIFGFKGKQVRDNIHSFDLVSAFAAFYQKPRSGEVYNIGGGRTNSCSVLEAIRFCEAIAGRKLKFRYDTGAHVARAAAVRGGDHQWYISSFKKFQTHYPQWQQRYNLQSTLQELFYAQKS